MLKQNFSSNFHVLNAPSFHQALQEVFKESCIVRLRGEVVVDDPEIISEEDHCGIRTPLPNADEIEPHFQWLEDTIRLHQELV